MRQIAVGIEWLRFSWVGYLLCRKNDEYIGITVWFGSQHLFVWIADDTDGGIDRREDGKTGREERGEEDRDADSRGLKRIKTTKKQKGKDNHESTPISTKGRKGEAWNVMRDTWYVMRDAWCVKRDAGNVRKTLSRRGKRGKGRKWEREKVRSEEEGLPPVCSSEIHGACLHRPNHGLKRIKTTKNKKAKTTTIYANQHEGEKGERGKTGRGGGGVRMGCFAVLQFVHGAGQFEIASPSDLCLCKR